jgi:2-amino-4-hydroxy-6-hydroxymethyldihydropteridine diphosphokinase
MKSSSPTTNLYLIGIGSNINPADNVRRALELLRVLGGRLIVSRIVQTEPVGMTSRNTFYNLVAYLETPIKAGALKTQFNKMEESFGRNRADPLSAVKDRPLDLDILVQIHPAIDWPTFLNETDSYYRPLVAEMIAHLAGDPLPPLSHKTSLGYVDMGYKMIGGSPQEIEL